MNALYLGIDESNTGRYPEVYVAVASLNPKDVIELYEPNLLAKIRIHKSLKRRIDDRDYRFLLNPKPLCSDMSIANIVASLIKGFDISKFDFIYPYIDGELALSKKNYIKKAFSIATGFEKSQITIHNGPGYDRKFEIVSISDQLANYLFRNTLEQISQNEHKVSLENFIS